MTPFFTAKSSHRIKEQPFIRPSFAVPEGALLSSFHCINYDVKITVAHNLNRPFVNKPQDITTNTCKGISKTQLQTFCSTAVVNRSLLQKVYIEILLVPNCPEAYIKTFSFTDGQTFDSIYPDVYSSRYTTAYQHQVNFSIFKCQCNNKKEKCLNAP